MTFVLLAALVAVNVAYLMYLDRNDKRAHAERADLLQRIQAPQAAVAQHHQQQAPPRREPDPREGLPASDEDLGLLDDDTRRHIAMLEAIENGTHQITDGVLA